MGGEEQIAELMNKIDEAVEEATFLEQTLDSYDALLAVSFNSSLADMQGERG